MLSKPQTDRTPNLRPEFLSEICKGSFTWILVRLHKRLKVFARLRSTPMPILLRLVQLGASLSEARLT